MNPYIGDRPLDPPEDDGEFYCTDCHSVFQYAECLYAHKENCPENMSDPGEPNEEPDL